MAEKWQTVAKAGMSLGIAERTLRRRIKEGKVTSKLINGRRMVLVDVTEADMSMAESGVPIDMPVAESDMPAATAETIDRLNEEKAALEQELERVREELSKAELRSALVDELSNDKARLQDQVDEKDKQMAEASQRHDTIVLQLTRQLEQSQRLLEYHEEPWYRRWFRKKQNEEMN